MSFSLDAQFCADLVFCFGHFLWQGIIVGSVFRVAVRSVAESRPELRYWLGVACLFILACCVPVTFALIGDNASVNVAQPLLGPESNATVGAEPVYALLSPTNTDTIAPQLTRAENAAGLPAEVMTDSLISGAISRHATLRWSIVAFSPWLVGIYITGVSLLLLQMALGIWAARGYRQLSTPVTDASLLGLLQSAMQRVGMTVAPPLRLCNRVIVPCVVGTLRPVIYLPMVCATGLSPGQIEQILVHELAHIKRWDPLVNLFQSVVETLLFFHPVVWLVSRQVRLEREHCCDRFVIGSGSTREHYAGTLLDVAALCAAANPNAVALAASGSGRSQLRQRIDRTLGNGPPRRTRWVEAGSAAFIAAALIACLVLAIEQQSIAQPPANQRTTEETTESPQSAALETIKAEEGKVVGVVVDTEGKPIEGALVDAWTWWKGTEVKTKADGSFVLNPKGDDRERVEIRISKPGYSPYYNHLQTTGGKPQMFALGTQTFLEGSVTDSEGKPVSDAVVRGEQGAKQADGVMISSVATETTTDADGQYRMYVFPDTYDLKISAPDRGVARLSGITVKENEGKKLDIRLREGVRFEAEVVDAESGEPVEGFVLWSWQQPGIVGKSDASGKLVIDSMLPGKFDFMVGGGNPVKINAIEGYFHGPFGRWWSADAVNTWERKDMQSGKFQRNFDNLSFDLSVGMPPVKIEVERGVVFFGKVFDPNGNPVEGATVAPAKTGSGNSLTGDTRYSEETKADGSYRVVMPAGNDFQYNLVAHDGKYQQWRNWANAVTDPIESHPGDQIQMEITLNRPATVQGRVVSPDNRNVAGLKVRAHAADLRGNRYYDPTAGKTDEDGAFELKFIRPGKHYIQVEPFWLSASDAPSESTTVVELAEGETKEGVEIQVAKTNAPATSAMIDREFSVKVVDADGQPAKDVALFTVSAMKPISVGLIGDRKGLADRIVSGTNSSPGKTDDDGLAKLEGNQVFGTQPSPTTIIAIAPQTNHGAIGTLFPDAKSDVLELKLEKLCDVSVEVSFDRLVNGDAIVKKHGFYLMRNGVLIELTQAAAPNFALQLPPGDYQLLIYAANSKPNTQQMRIPAADSFSLKPIELQPDKLSQLFGKPAPELADIAEWLGDDPGSLETLRGRVVLLDFWGYWCGPCVAAMPELMMIHDEYDKERVTIIGVHDGTVTSAEQLTERTEAARKAWSNRALPFPTAIAGGGQVRMNDSDATFNGRVIADYGITAFPTTLLIDKKGIIVGQIHLNDPESARKAIDQQLAIPEEQ